MWVSSGGNTAIQHDGEFALCSLPSSELLSPGMASSAAAPPAAGEAAPVNNGAQPGAAPTKLKWIPVARDYETEARLFSLLPRFKKVAEHPLIPAAGKAKPLAVKDAVKVVDGKSVEPSASPTAASASNPLAPTPTAASAPDFDDPLRMFSAAAPVVNDPLRALATSSNNAGSSAREAITPLSGTTPTAASGAGLDHGVLGGRSIEAWANKRLRIRQKYTTNARMAVSANFMDEGPSATTADGKPKAVDQMTSRLEQLELDPESQVAKNFLTQNEYIAHIETQHDNLKSAWDNGERVLSLKIAIQCAKLLSDTKVPQFYPSMFVLISDILDTFGNLVFDRIKRKGTVVEDSKRAATTATALPDNFKSRDVSAEAQETCRNWFYKTACIRELLPRLYVDLALLKCNRFLMDDGFGDIVMRLSKAIRGVGDPLVAMYARAYLCTKTLELAPFYNVKEAEPNPLLACFDDFLFCFKALKSSQWKVRCNSYCWH